MQLRMLALPLSLTLTSCSQAMMGLGASYDPNVIRIDEAQSVEAGSAYELVRKLRPSFLASRGPTTILGTSSAYPTVFVDGIRYGTIGSLAAIPASWIAEVRLYRTSAPPQFGSDNMSGVLAITTRLRR